MVAIALHRIGHFAIFYFVFACLFALLMNGGLWRWDSELGCILSFRGGFRADLVKQLRWAWRAESNLSRGMIYAAVGNRIPQPREFGKQEQWSGRGSVSSFF